MERKKLTKSKAYFRNHLGFGIFFIVFIIGIIYTIKREGISDHFFFIFFICGLVYFTVHAYSYLLMMLGFREISFNSQELSYNYKGKDILISLNKVRDYEVQGKRLVLVLSEVPTGNRIIFGMIENKTIINEFIEYRKHAIEKYGIADDLASVL